jgi:hypothetical protein
LHVHAFAFRLLSLSRRSTVSRPVSARGVLKATLIVAIVLYAALLRLDAITQQFGPVTHPAWLQALQHHRTGGSRLRPAGLQWPPAEPVPHAGGPPTLYRSDPYTYLKYAREMHFFYAAHRREPLFPFATKVFLALLDQQDVAVSFASAAFSVLTVAATFVLGAMAFSYAVGAGAALLLAIEYDVISWGTGGWRDDAFMFSVVLSAIAFVHYRCQPSARRAGLIGMVAGFACLVRITSLSFLIPAFGYMLLVVRQPWRTRARDVALASAVLAIIVGPFLVNCWRTFGDPLYAINVHADVYRASDGQAAGPSQTAGQYIGSQVRARPVRTLETLVLGLTQYPFTNKWTGFDPWMHSAGTWLSWASLAGLMLFAGSPAGRLMLLILGASLVPYALTWRLAADWRFTQHAYPFLLIATWLALTRAALALSPATWRNLRAYPPTRHRMAFWAGAAGLVVVCWLMVTRGLPLLTFEETLHAHEPATIQAGDRDAAFFVNGWSRRLDHDTVTTWIADGPRGDLRLRLPAVGDYDALARVDPFPAQCAAARHPLKVLLNGRPVGACPLTYDPQRIGVCRFRVPAEATKQGFNRVSFVTDPGSTRGFRLWYLRLTPPVQDVGATESR